MTTVESIAVEMLTEGRSDWVPVDTAIGWAREVAAEDGGDFRSTAIAVIEYLVLGGLMVAGEIGDDGFEEWPGTPAESVRKVVEKCEELNWEPFGAACWLSNTEAGDMRVS